MLVERGIAEGTVRPDIRPAMLARLIEASAIAVLVDAAETGIDDAEGRRLVMLAVLGTAGLCVAGQRRAHRGDTRARRRPATSSTTTSEEARP